MLDLSIIIVSWNAKKFLGECLASIPQGCLAHSYEVIVVDNASNDGSPELVETRFPRTRLIRNERNEGFARGNNIGIRQSRGKYLALINSDVVVTPQALDRLIEFLERTPRAGIVGPKVLNSDGSLQASFRPFPTVRLCLLRTFGLDNLLPRWGRSRFAVRGGETPNETRPVDVLSGCFWVLRREPMERVGLLDESFYIYGEDMDWCRRFHGAGFDVVYDPEVAIIHHGGASSANAPVRYFVEMQKADLHYWEKHHGWWGRQFYAANLLLHQLLRLPPRLVQYLARPRERNMTGLKIDRSVACLRWLWQQYFSPQHG